MRRALLGRAVAVGLVASGALGALAATPANADCVQVDFEVRYEDGSKWYPLGEPDRCVVPTPWNHSHESHAGDDLHEPQPGLPSGWWLEVWVPLP
jgi:hypothetical protein